MTISSRYHLPSVIACDTTRDMSNGNSKAHGFVVSYVVDAGAAGLVEKRETVIDVSAIAFA